MAARLLAVLGGRWMTGDGQPLDADLTRHALYRLYSVLIALDLIQDDKAMGGGPLRAAAAAARHRPAHLWTVWRTS